MSDIDAMASKHLRGSDQSTRSLATWAIKNAMEDAGMSAGDLMCFPLGAFPPKLAALLGEIRMSEEVFYLTAPWFKVLEEEAQAAVDAAAIEGARFSLLERYEDAPDEFRPSPDLFAGFRVDVADGRAIVRPGAAAGETADLVLEISWEGANRVAGSKSGLELDGLIGDFIEAGSMNVVGSLDDFPADINAFHDAVQARTTTHFK